jgi:hypothetical protein
MYVLENEELRPIFRTEKEELYDETHDEAYVFMKCVCYFSLI